MKQTFKCIANRPIPLDGVEGPVMPGKTKEAEMTERNRWLVANKFFSVQKKEAPKPAIVSSTPVVADTYKKPFISDKPKEAD